MARSFNGSTDKIITSSVVATGAQGPFTFAVWALGNDVGSTRQTLIFNGKDGGTDGYGMLFKDNSGNTGEPGFLVTNVAFHNSSVTVSAGTWYSFVATVVPNGGSNIDIAMWVTAVGATPNQGINDTNQVAGTAPTTNVIFGTDTFGHLFNGSMADAAIWTAKLTVGEIGALAQGARPYTIRPGSLKGYWPLDGLQSPEPSLIGAANNGTLTGTALAPGPPVMQFTPRWPQTNPVAAGGGSAIKFRKTLSQIGGRVGTRQQIGWGM